MKKYVFSIDQGTTGSRVFVFNKNGEILASRYKEHQQIFPEEGWVEHDPVEILQNCYLLIKSILTKTKISIKEIDSIGITNQRETSIIWNKKTGIPVYNAIVWQDTRTAKMCENIISMNKNDLIKEKTGLPISPYFSATKINWILKKISITNKSDLLFGTIDTWLLWNLTGGINGGIHKTDVTNASRTMLMNLEKLEWDDELLTLFDIPREILPEISPSINSAGFGLTSLDSPFGCEIPITGILGDQQAALFGQTCFEVGDAKCTYGTGCFLLMNIGTEIKISTNGLITTPAYKINNEKTIFALEGSIAVAGSLVQWFRDNFEMISSSAEIEIMARKEIDNGGVYFVPAFSGLFAPHWNSSARGIIIGLTHKSNKNHVARAIIEATAFQANDILKTMEKESKLIFHSLKVDGGMTSNNLLMQFQADLSEMEIIRPEIQETTALGAAFAAGIATGFWKKDATLKHLNKQSKSWHPLLNPTKRAKLIKKWNLAVEKSKNWLEDD